MAVNIPATVPGDASPNIDPSFVGFAFEETSFPQYAGEWIDPWNGRRPDTTS